MTEEKKTPEEKKSEAEVKKEIEKAKKQREIEIKEGKIISK